MKHLTSISSNPNETILIAGFQGMNVYNNFQENSYGFLIIILV